MEVEGRVLTAALGGKRDVTWARPWIVEKFIKTGREGAVKEEHDDCEKRVKVKGRGVI